MSSVNLPPEKFHELADSTEDQAYEHPPGSQRQQLLAVVYQMRAAANRALWLGDEVAAETIEAAEAPLLIIKLN